MDHHHGGAWLALAAIVALGCSSGGNGGDQPYGAGTSARDDEEVPETDAGPEPMAGTGGVGGASGLGGMGGEIIAGHGGLDEAPECVGIPLLLPIGACVTLPESATNEFVSMTGVVEAIEQPDGLGCFLRWLGTMSFPEQGEFYDVVIGDGASTVRMSVRLPFSTPFVNVGDTVSIEYEAEPAVTGLGKGDIKVHDADGKLIFYVVQAMQGFDNVGLSELMISDDPQTKCATEQSCAASRHGGIRAFDGRDEASIEYGAMAEVGDFVVLLGDNRELLLGCGEEESYYHRVMVAAVDDRVLSMLDDD